MTRHSIAASLAALLLALPARAEHAHGPAEGVLSLDVYAAGARLHVFTGEKKKGSDQPQLWHARSDDGGATWSLPVRVDASLPPAKSPHRGMDPQIAAAGDRLIAVWMTAGTDAWGSGPMATALSADDGRTWQPGPNPADDGLTTGHGFIDIAADGGGAFHLTWLDSRDGRQGLRYARSTDGGRTWSRNQSLKPATCECCSNVLATGPQGNVAILFRDGSPRDMGLVLSRDGGQQWHAPLRIGDFGWQFNGCPHVGGGLAFTRATLHAIVWSGMSEHMGVHYFASPDSGGTWSQPRQLGSATATHPDIATDAEQRIAAVWEDRTGEHPAVWTSVSKDDGASWGQPMQLSQNGLSASHPRIVTKGAGFRAFWTESRGEGPARWQSAPVP